VWEFGDESTKSGTYEIKHIYKYPGKYTTTVKAKDKYGDTATGVTTIMLYKPRAITAIHATNTKLYKTTKIFVNCISPDSVSLKLSNGKKSMVLTKIPCNSEQHYGPLLEPGIYKIEAFIPGCDKSECIKSTTFHVKAEIPRIKTPDMPFGLVPFLAFIVIAVAKRRFKRNRNCVH